MKIIFDDQSYLSIDKNGDKAIITICAVDAQDKNSSIMVSVETEIAKLEELISALSQ